MSLEPLGLARETRPFHPHVTLARVKRAGSRTETIWSGLDAQAGAARISEVVLYRSHLESTGARYESLVRVALDGQTGSTSPAPE